MTVALMWPTSAMGSPHWQQVTAAAITIVRVVRRRAVLDPLRSHAIGGATDDTAAAHCR